MKTKAKRYRLKAWGHPLWQRKLSRTLTVSRVDEDIPTERQKSHRKPWFVALTQKAGSAGDRNVDGIPAGTTLLLSEHEIVQLVCYLLEPQTAMFTDNPSPTEPCTISAVFFSQPGMVAISESGQVFNGEARWSPSYFMQQEPIETDTEIAKGKIHTLPWVLPDLETDEGVAASSAVR